MPRQIQDWNLTISFFLFVVQTVSQMGVPLDTLGFEPELQTLYVAVNSLKSAQKRKRSSDSSPAAEDISVPEHQTSDHQQTNDVHTGCSLVHKRSCSAYISSA